MKSLVVRRKEECRVFLSTPCDAFPSRAVNERFGNVGTPRPIRFRALRIMVREPARQPGKRGGHCHCFEIGRFGSRVSRLHLFSRLPARLLPCARLFRRFAEVFAKLSSPVYFAPTA